MITPHSENRIFAEAWLKQYNKTMQDIMKTAQDYLKEHPEVEKLLKQFHTLWEQYQRFLETMPIPQTQSISTPSNQENLKANTPSTSRTDALNSTPKAT